MITQANALGAQDAACWVLLGFQETPHDEAAPLIINDAPSTSTVSL